jgi:hypothetical protein
MRWIALASLLACGWCWILPTLYACTFCSGALRNRQTLREQYHDAAVVLLGVLKQPRLNSNGIGGTTEFHIRQRLKCPAAQRLPDVMILPRYLPSTSDPSSPTAEFLIFGTWTDGKFDLISGMSATPTLVEYLRAAVAIPGHDRVRQLAYAFRMLDSTDPAVAADAFLTLGKASDTELVEARSVFEPQRLRRWLRDPQTPEERIGVLAMLLGLHRHPDDAAVFTALLSESPRPERISSNLGGILAGYLLVHPEAGWRTIEQLLAEGTVPFNERLAAIGTLRFMQATRGDDARPAILRCYRTLIRQGELADLAIEDLRQWGWWDLTADVLSIPRTVANPPPILRRGVVRYALSCPQPEARQYLTRLRQTDPQLLASVEESLAIYETIRTAPRNQQRPATTPPP